MLVSHSCWLFLTYTLQHELIETFPLTLNKGLGQISYKATSMKLLNVSSANFQAVFGKTRSTVLCLSETNAILASRCMARVWDLGEKFYLRNEDY